jgi:hypothetical protein
MTLRNPLMLSALAGGFSLTAPPRGAGAATQLDVTRGPRDVFLDANRVHSDAEFAFARASWRVAADLPLEEHRP